MVSRTLAGHCRHRLPGSRPPLDGQEPVQQHQLLDGTVPPATVEKYSRARGQVDVGIPGARGQRALERVECRVGAFGLDERGAGVDVARDLGLRVAAHRRHPRLGGRAAPPRMGVGRAAGSPSVFGPSSGTVAITSTRRWSLSARAAAASLLPSERVKRVGPALLCRSRCRARARVRGRTPRAHRPHGRAGGARRPRWRAAGARWSASCVASV